MTELIAGKAVEAVSNRANDCKAKRLQTPIIKLRLWRVECEVDKITAGQEQTTWNCSGDIVLPLGFHQNRRISH